jgi:Flp pilus assembly protein TadD
MDLGRRAAVALGLAVFLISAAVYLITLTPTVPFWDSGEFIAVSYILGIPHPPGTPFYVMLGRVATLVPWATVAQRVNALSAISSALAVMFTALVGLQLLRRCFGPQRTRTQEWLAIGGAALAALMLAFSDNFWENSIEAEVYSMMSLAQILVFWLGLRWWESHERRPTVVPLLVAVYVMWLCVGLHLGVGMMGLPLLVLTLLVDRKVAILLAMPFLSVLLVTWGLERMAGGVLLGTTALTLYFVSKRRIPGLLGYASAACSAYGTYVGMSDVDFSASSATVSVLSVLVPMTLLARKGREGRVILLALILMTVGYSTHLYLPIRAAQHPAINEGDPSNWERLRDLLERKQYGTTSMFVRRAPLAAQLDKEFWRYFQRQWPLLPTARPWAGALLPLLLGVGGAVWHAKRDRTSFYTSGVMFLFATAGMIAFLNFTDHEVRDRDYFFTSAYHWYALWIGMGAVWLVGWVRESFPAGRVQAVTTGSTAVLLMVQPALLCKHQWFTHDRHNNYVAHDYAYNMLAPLAPNSFVFTNGDNDTFPLWYMQEVERCRKDVRVVNLSLLNTDWYIRQLRDQEPRVPIALDDRSVDLLGRGGVQDSTGRFLYTSQFMIEHIIQQDRTPDGKGWRMQPYFAVTVPEHQGLDPYFTLEGLVSRVNPDSLGPRIDAEATHRALYEVFKYRGLFRANGDWDSTVYKDENASTLTRNYMAAHVELGIYYRRIGQTARAIAEYERVARMFPEIEIQLPLGALYMEVGDTTRAMELYARLAERHPESPEARYYHGVSLMYRGDIEGGAREFDAAIELDPNFNLAYYAAYTMLQDRGQHERALSYLERWISLHPSDSTARQLLESRRRSLGAPGRSGSPLPPPPTPGFP